MRQISRLRALLALFLLIGAAGLQPSHAQTTTLHSFEAFQNGVVVPDGAEPSPLVQGTDGSFYGTTPIEGSPGYGTAFKITMSGAFTLLHGFRDGTTANDGASPSALILGSDGNFYGTTRGGGSTATGSNPYSGGGTVFAMTPAGAVTILHSFGDGSVPSDGLGPATALVQATDGDFYGATTGGGSAGKGTIFRMTPAGVVTVLHSFGDGSVANEGSRPSALVQGGDGDFYGTTAGGGLASFGTVYKMTPAGVVTVLHSFDDGTVANDGEDPVASLLLGRDGNFYGTTDTGGSAVSTNPYGPGNGYGTVFKMTPAGTVTILHIFNNGGTVNDGSNPEAPLIQAVDGSFYGTTFYGGSTGSYGALFKITATGALTILHSFGDGSVASEGTRPATALVQGRDGNFYGTTSQGGAGGSGTAFQFIPAVIPSKPAITGFSPSSGPVGTVVTITGTNLTGTSVVGFTGQHAQTFTVNGAGTQITATVPMGAVTGPIAVLTPGGQAKSAASFTVTATAQKPAITGFTPASGPVGTVVTITGTNLTGATVVGFTGKHAASFTVNAAGTQITTTVPAGAITGPIAVATPNGTAKSAASFTVMP